MSKRMVSGALALTLAAVLGGAQPAAAFTTRARIVDFAFKPKRLEIPQGSRVLWLNKGDETHTVTARNGDFDSGELAPGEKFSYKFLDTGVFRYYCEIHPDEMKGRVLPGDV